MIIIIIIIIIVIISPSFAQRALRPLRTLKVVCPPYGKRSIGRWCGNTQIACNSSRIIKMMIVARNGNTQIACNSSRISKMMIVA